MRVVEVRSEENHIFAWAAAVIIITRGKGNEGACTARYAFFLPLGYRKEENGKTNYMGEIDGSAVDRPTTILQGQGWKG